MEFIKHNWILLVLLFVALVIYSFGVSGWLWDNGHRGLSLTGYGIFVLLLIYCRANRLRKRTGGRKSDTAQG
jgi:hypothetical protein